MSTLVFALGAALVIMSAALVGVITLNKFVADWTHRNLTFLVSFSAGVMSIVVLGLVWEAREVLTYVELVGFALLGAALIAGLGTLLPESHHHHLDDECHPCDEPPRPHATRILVADAIHNIGDGLLLVPAFAISTTLGLGLTLALVAHELAQELSEFFVLRQAGLSVRQALTRNVLAASTILPGVILGYYALHSEWHFALLGLAAGAFAYIIAEDLLPHSIAHAKKHGLGRHLVWAFGGVLIMSLISFLAPHVHVEGDAEHDHEHEESAVHSH